MDFLESFHKFLSSPAQASKTTIKNYKADISQFITWYEAKYAQKFNPNLINASVIETFKTQASQNLSQSSLNRHMSSLRKFFHYLKIEGLASKDPFEEIKFSFDQAEDDPFKLKDFKNNLYVYNASKLTIKNYLIDVKQFMLWAQEVLGTQQAWNESDKNIFNHIDSRLIEEYKTRLLKEGKFSPASVNRKLSSLRKYFSWAMEEGLIPHGAYDTNSVSEPKPASAESIREHAASIQKPQALGLPEETKANRSFIGAPMRLTRKLASPFVAAFEASLILPLARGFEKAEHAAWALQGKPIFHKKKGNFSLPFSSAPSHKAPTEVHNLPKEMFAPAKVSTKYLPVHRKIWFHARYTRPNWYRKYHSYPVTTYFHIAILIIFMTAVGFGFYNAFFVQKQKATLAAPTAPPRILSFQGRLTDTNDNPITSTTLVRFAIYDDPTATGGANPLWQEQQGISPDSDGIFSVLLGNITSIPQSVFTDHANLYLGVTVGWTDELFPRQRLATVSYAANSESLQGMLPLTTGNTNLANKILNFDSSGNLTFAGSTAPVFQATGGNFTISGSGLILTTAAGSASNVTIIPDGLGKIDIQKPLVNTTNSNNISQAQGGVEVDDNLAVLATSSGIPAFLVKQTGTADLIVASTSATTEFRVDSSGNVTANGNGTFNGTTLSLGNGTASTINTPSSNANLSITPNGSGTLNLGTAANNVVSIGNASGNVSLAGNGITANTNSVLYVGSGGVLGTATTGSSGLCLTSQANTPAWNPCTSSNNFWAQTSGLLYPLNSTVDFAIGGQATTSAIFAVLNVNSGAPVASISSGLNGNAAYLTSGGVLGTARKATLQVGDSNTGDINFYSSSNKITSAGNLTIAGNLVLSNSSATTTFGGIAYTWPTSGQSNGYALVTNGSGTLSWSDNTLNFGLFSYASGAIFPRGPYTSIADFLIGSSATNSAKFSVLNVNNGTPTASVSSGLNGNSTYLTADGTLATTRRQTLTIGNSSTYNTTGNIVLNPNGTGNVGVGTSTPNSAFEVAGQTFLGTQTLTGNDQSDVIFFSNSTGTAGQSGNFNNKLKIFGGNSATRNLTIYQTGGGSAFIDSSFGSLQLRTTGNNADINLITNGSGKVGVNTTTTLASLDVRQSIGTLAVASVSGQTSFANLVVDQTGVGDIFAASSAGKPLFTITGSGAIGLGSTVNIGTSAQCLTGGVNPSWGTCGSGTGVNWWGQTNGLLYPLNSTVDFAIGGQATTSAKFAVLNVNSGVPVASISSGLNGQAAYLTSDGSLQTARNASLNVGGSTTGDIQFKPGNSGTSLYLTSAGNAGLGTTTPLSKLDVNGGVAVGTYAGSSAAPSNGLIVSGNIGSGVTSPTVTVPGGAGNIIQSAGFVSAARTGDTGFHVYNGGGVTEWAIHQQNPSVLADSSLYFSRLAGGTYQDSPLVLSYDGNVGIQQSNPTAKLDVSNTNQTTAVNITSTNSVGTGLNVNVTPGNIGTHTSDSPFFNSGNFAVGLTADLEGDSHITANGVSTDLETTLTLGDSTAGKNSAVNKAINNFIGDTVTYNETGGSNGNDYTGSGIDSTTSSIAYPTAFINPSTFVTYGANITNSSSVNGGTGDANLTSTSYGIKNTVSGDLGTTGTTNHYGEYVDVSGTAVNNYGLYINGVTGATNNYSIKAPLFSVDSASNTIIGDLSLDPIGGLLLPARLGIMNTDKAIGTYNASTSTVQDALIGNSNAVNVNAPVLGSITSSQTYIGNSNLIAPSGSISLDGAGTLTTLGTLNLNGVTGTLGDSSGGANTLTTGGDNITLSSTVTFNQTGGSAADTFTAYGIQSNISTSIANTAVINGVANTYGAYLSNNNSSNGNANLTAANYGLYAKSAGNLTTTGSTTHYGGYFDVSGSANNNYGIYINNVTGGTANYALYSAANAQSYFTGAATGKALFNLNETGNQDIFTASASGTPVFSLTRAGGIKLGLSEGTSGNCLISGGAGSAASWSNTCLTSYVNYWGQTSGLLYPLNSTVDFAIGGQASNSAKFAVLNINSGNPTASVSSGLNGNAAYLTSVGSLQTARNATLVLGGSTTGDIQFKPGNSSSSLYLNSNGNVGINSTSPLATLDIRRNSGTLPVASLSGATSFASLVVDNSGNGDIFTASSSGLNRFVITQSGNVGIGTTNPGTNQLQVEASGINADIAIRSSGGSGRIYSLNSRTDGKFSLRDSTKGVDLIFASGVGTLPTASVSSFTSFAGVVLDQQGLGDIFTASNAGTPRFTIQANGNVLVGTNTVFNTAGILQSSALSGTYSNALTLSSSSNNISAGTLTLTLGSDATGDLYYRGAGGSVTRLADVAIGSCLTSGGVGAAPAWGSCQIGAAWTQDTSNLVLYPSGPYTSVTDVLVGGTSTASAKFGVLNIASGTPTASVSSGINGNSTYITADGTLATTRRQTLTIGNSSTYNTTGNVLINPNGTGNVSIGTTDTTAILNVASTTTNATLYNPGSGVGVIIRGLNGSTTGQLRIVPNTGAWADSQTTTYFQITNSTNNNATFMGGTFGSDTVLNRLQFNSNNSQFSDYTFGNTPVPTSILEALSSTGSKTALKVLSSGSTLAVATVSGQTSFSTLVVNQNGVGDIFTASSAGKPLFTILGSGDLQTHYGLGLLHSSSTGLITSSKVDLSSTNDVTNTLGVGNGGTGVTNPATGSLLVGAGSSAMTVLTIGGANTCLTSNGTTPSWSSCSTTGPWTQDTTNLVLYPSGPYTNVTDLLVGGTSTASAKFGVLNIANGTPTASVSSGLNGNASYLTSAGVLGTARKATLQIGDSNTGDINFYSSSNKINSSGALTIASNFTLGGSTQTFTAANSTITGSTGITLQETGDSFGTLGLTIHNRNGENGAIVDASASTIDVAELILKGQSLQRTIRLENRSASKFVAAPEIEIGAVTDPTLVISDNLTAIRKGTFTIGQTSSAGGSISTLSTLDVRGTSGTLSVASVSGTTALASLIVDQRGVGDIFAASSAGKPLFTITGSGGIGLGATINIGTSAQCLTGGVNPSWGTCGGGGTNYWEQASGALYPLNDTVDFLVGAHASSSAKFAVLNIANGTPTASVSSGLNGNASYLTAAGVLGTARKATLQIGDSNTGDINFYSTSNVLNSSGNLTLAGNVRINGNNILDSAGNNRITFSSNTITLGSTTTLTDSSLATINAASTLAFNGTGTINTDQTALTLFNTTATTVNFAGAATTFNLGAPTGSASTSATYTFGGTSATLRPATGPLSLGYKSGFNTWGTALTVQDTTGNIGIGTTAPTDLLQVNGAVGILNQNGLRLYNSGNTSFATLSFDGAFTNLTWPFKLSFASASNPLITANLLSGTGSVATISGNTSFAALVVDNSQGDLITASSSGQNRFVVRQNGSVGIGTSQPTATLDVRGSASVAGNLAFTGNNSTNNIFALNNDNLNISISPSGSPSAVGVGNALSGNAGTFSTTNQTALGTGVASASAMLSAAVNGGDFAYIIAGSTSATAQSRAIQYSQLDGSGNMGAWGSVANAVTQANGLSQHATVMVGNKWIYALGGTSGGTNQTTIQRSNIGSNGVPSTFANTSQGLPFARFGLGAFTFTATAATNSGTMFIYAVGGQNGNTVQTTVYQAQLTATGDITSAPRTTDQQQLGTGQAVRNMAVAGPITINGSNYVYLIGGTTTAPGDGTVTTQVLKLTINAAGDVTTVTPMTQVLPAARQLASAQAASIGGVNYLFVEGGDNGGTAQSTVYQATLDSNGNVVSWTTNNQSALTAITTAGSAFLGFMGNSGTPYIYMAGGSGYTAPNFTTGVVRSQVSVQNSRFYLANSGNIGFGTINPNSFSLQIAGNVGPDLDNIWNLGASSSGRFANLYLGPDSVHIQCTTTDGCPQNLDWSMTTNTLNGAFGIGANLFPGATPTLNITPLGQVAIGTTSALATFDVRASNNSLSVASISGNTGLASLVVDNSGTGDLITASSAGILTNPNRTQFRVDNVGGVYGRTYYDLDNTAFFLDPAATSNSLIAAGGAGFGFSATTTRLAVLDVRALNGTLSVASVSGNTGLANLVVDQTGTGDIFTASSAGKPLFTITGTGGIALGATKSVGTSSQCIFGGVNPSWGSCGSTWTQDTTNLVLYPTGPYTNVTDVLIGATATKSAKFAVLNIANGTPVASVSSGLNGAGTFLTADGKLDTTNKQTLSLGTQSSTGMVNIGNGGGSLFLETDIQNISTNNTGFVKVTDKFWVTNNESNALSIFDNTGTGDLFTASASGATKFVVKNSGRVGIGTVAPRTVLDVVGSSTSTASAFFENSTTTAASQGIVVKMGATTPGNTTHLADFLDLNGKIVGDIRFANTTSVQYQTNGIADFAEYLDKNPNEHIDWGSALCEGSDGYVHPCSTANGNNSITGIASEFPSFVGGNDKGAGSITVGMSGQVALLVSNKNGNIQPGDVLTISDIPGVAVKATQPGQTIGKALQSFNGSGCVSNVNGYCVGKVYTVVNINYFDPTPIITDAQSLSNFAITRLSDGTYKVFDQAGNAIDKAQALASAVIGNLSAGLIKTEDLFARNTTTTNLNTDVITPLQQDLTIRLASPGGKFKIQNNLGKTVASIDDQGNASLAGKLASDNLEVSKDATISGTLHAGTIIADQILGLPSSSPSANYITNNYFVASSSGTASDSGNLAYNFDGNYQFASLSAQLADFNQINGQTATFYQGLMAFGPSSLYDLSVVDQLSVGAQLTIADHSINVLGGDLQIQPLKQGGVDFLAGAVKISSDGDLIVNGDATFAKNVSIQGILSANIWSSFPDQNITFKLNGSNGQNSALQNVSVKNASDSSVFTINSTGDFMASGAGTLSKLNLSIEPIALAVSDTEVIATGSAGVATISAHQSELTIDNSSVTDKSLIYITPKADVSDVGGVYLMRQVPGKSFTVGINSPANTKLPFNWIIIN